MSSMTRLICKSQEDFKSMSCQDPLVHLVVCNNSKGMRCSTISISWLRVEQALSARGSPR